MKGMHLNFLIAFSFLLMGCKVRAKEMDSENYEVYSNHLVNSFAKAMKKEFGLVCIGDGGRMPHDVEVLSVSFNAYQRATIEQARDLEVKVTERFIKAINADEKIRPFLREYPVKAFRAEVAISFVQKNNHPYTDGSVAYVFQVKNKIFYKKRDSSSPRGFAPLLEEPYNDAFKIAQTKENQDKR